MALSASARYWLAQIPGHVVAAAVLVLLWARFGLPGWLAAAIFGAFVVKDLVFFPFAKRTLESPHQVGHESLVGRRAQVVQALGPTGRVRLGGELWWAEARREDAPIGEGVEVRVEAVRGLTLQVRPDP